MPEETIDDKKTLKSEYNEASYQILRLHNLWTNYSNYSREERLYLVHTTLESIWIELSADAKQTHFDCIKKFNDSIGMHKDNKIKVQIALKLKAIFLKKLQDDVGKGGKKTEGYEKMI